MKSTKVYFDLDGTLFNLYGKDNWLNDLRNERAGVFTGDHRLFDNTFYEVVSDLLNSGVEFGVITWLPMQASPEYEEVCRQEKLDWIREYLPFVSEINICSYGIPKQNLIQKRASTMILIDDNKEVCDTWETETNCCSLLVNNGGISELTATDALTVVFDLI